MKTSIKLVIGAIVLPSFVVGGYLAYAYIYEKPKNVKDLLDLIKTRFDQNKTPDKYVAKDWETVLKKTTPTNLRKLKKTITFILNAPPTLDADSEKLAEENMAEINEMKKSLITSGFWALMEKNGGLPYGT